MSLALRYGTPSATQGLLAAAVASVPRMPRLPVLSDFFPGFGAPGAAENTGGSAEPSTLQRLKQALQERGIPFGFDNGAILKAAPKKRPSHRRTREKLYAPGNKQIQPLENLVRCPACGHVKRLHLMCMHCFGEIRTFLKAKKRQLLGEKPEPQLDLDPVDEKILYPGKYMRDVDFKMKKREWVPKREEPLMYDRSQLKK